jgi:Tol biopolymer transport system component
MIAAAVTAFTLAAEPVGPRLLVSRGGAIVSTAASGGSPRRLLAGTDAAWSPDGTLLAYARNGDLWLANDDGSGRRPLTRTPNATESEPSWSPAGKTIAYTVQFEDGSRRIRVLRLPFGTSDPLVGSDSWSPAFSPDGKRLAFVSSRSGSPEVYVARADGTGAKPFHTVDPTQPQPSDVRDLAWGPAGRRLAYAQAAEDGTSAIVVDDGQEQKPVTQPGERDDHPVWSPDGKRLAWSEVVGDHARRLILGNADGSASVDVGAGAPLDWQHVPLGRPRFPDLVQRPPSGLVVTRQHGRWELGFTSLVDNRGPGILWIHGSRPAHSPLMDVIQLIQLAGGGIRYVSDAGFLHYTVAPPHYHWHLLGYDRYTLRRVSDFSVVVRDRKSGFCLADHHGIARGIGHGPPRFLANCAQFHPEARALDEGTSVGYTDRYPAYFHGQSIDLTGVTAGRYWLVHQVNSNLGLRELRYDNDTASLLVRITWPGGHGSAPRVQPLYTCLKERC